MVKFVICGLERSGTTIVSELFRQVPGVDAGFEIGVLLGRTPREFPDLQPYADNMLPNWGITRRELRACCDTDDFTVFYARLRQAAGALKPETSCIFDKTPRYLATLDDCMAKTKAPFIVTFKDPRSTVYSDFRISGQSDFASWFDAYAPDKIGYMRLHYAQYRRVARARHPRVCLVRLEELCLQPRAQCSRILGHVGFAFENAYLAFRQGRYQPAQNASIMAGMPFTYKNALRPEQTSRISDAFGEFEEWFFE